MTRKSTRIANQPAHELLATLGKRTLRPGGEALTRELLEALSIAAADDVVEFAPGVGATARLALDRNPNSYTGIELDRERAARLRKQLENIDRPVPEIVVGNAADTDLPRNSADAVYGEAMLTMQPDGGKRAILEEARRLLRPGGRYGVHELALADGVDDETAVRIRREAAQVANVRPQPLTESGWVDRLESAGFTVMWRALEPMALLEPRRVLADEGLLGTLRIGYNLLRRPQARRRVRSLRRIFERYEEQLRAIALVAERS
ncbi:class I SAM-dependent methyltransferase [Halopiger xanaduensis]|uniref:Methyltransferase type 11 n=1 Tax=Halopiger xanaduensis (strain DSM 18323 / JCM 14033 / SH-6) TaxID=797210 RepID=F8D328_HALXS|nr:class I SAM-dependent methyltransferase [Halopiger xanaduensis]AEH37312.1 Methyltransferase type 11 [Halopiger xanaduensis SH-6]